MLAEHLNSKRIAELAATIKNVNGELLSQGIRLVAHHDTEAKVTHFGIFGDSAGTGKRLRQAADHQSDCVFRKRQVMSRYAARPSVGNVLRTEDEEVFDLPDLAFDYRIDTG